eukprot:201853_1
MRRFFISYLRIITASLAFLTIGLVFIILPLFNEEIAQLDEIQIILPINITVPTVSKYERVRSPLPTDLGRQHEACITDMIVNTTCHLPLNSSFTITGTLGRGAVAIVYSVLFHEDNKTYAMKFNYGGTTAVRGEYSHLYQLKSYATDRNISLHVPWLHPVHPPYYYIRANVKRKFRCFIFIEQLDHAMSWNGMEKGNVYQDIIAIHGNILQFFLTGYQDIMDVFQAMDELNVYHNDFHEGNILINKDDFRFYLIDFGDLFENNGWHWLNRKEDVEFKCCPHTCPPSTWYYLHSLGRRLKFTKEYDVEHYGGNATNSEDDHFIEHMDALAEYAKYSKRYEMISIIFHGFIHFYCTDIVNNEMCDGLLQMNQRMRMFRNPKNRKGVAFDDVQLYIDRWCMRHQMMDILHKQSDHLQGIHSVKHKTQFWSLMEIYDDDWKYVDKNACKHSIIST